LAYIVIAVFLAVVLFWLLRFVLRRRRWPMQKESQKIDLRELRRIEIEYGQKNDPDDRRG
jgi:hypothetical protein